MPLLYCYCSLPCGLQDLEVFFSTGSVDIIDETLLEVLPRLSLVKVLHLKFHKKIPYLKVTTHICSALRSSKELREIVFQEGYLDEIWGEKCFLPLMVDIIEAMRTSPSLDKVIYKCGKHDDRTYCNTCVRVAEQCETKLLEILKTDNTKLSYFSLEPRAPYESLEGPLRTQVDFFLALNHHGRSIIRAPDTNITKLIELLSPDSFHRSRRFRIYCTSSRELEMRIFNVRYGLLREAPDIWAHGLRETGSNKDSSRKRKTRTSRKRKTRNT